MKPFLINYWLPKINKIMPTSKAPVIFKIWGIAVIITFTFILFPLPDKSFYKQNISGTVNSIKKQHKEWEILIDTNWYTVKMPNIDQISLGTAIVKPQNSYSLTIYNQNKNIKYRIENKNILFKKIEHRKIPVKR